MKFYRWDFGVLHRGGEWAEQGRVEEEEEEEEESKKAAGAEGLKAPAMRLMDWLWSV